MMEPTSSWVTSCSNSPQWPLADRESLNGRSEVEKGSEMSRRSILLSQVPMQVPRPWLASVSLRGRLWTAPRNWLVSGLQQFNVGYRGVDNVQQKSHMSQVTRGFGQKCQKCKKDDIWQEGAGCTYANPDPPNFYKDTRLLLKLLLIWCWSKYKTNEDMTGVSWYQIKTFDGVTIGML